MPDKQQYENYWSITLEYSDIFGEKFNNCLQMIVDFIDSHGSTPYTPAKYDKLTEIVEKVYPKKDSASTRKSINQFVRLGFIEQGLTGYHADTKAFIDEQNKIVKRTIFSKIVYENASLNRTVTHPSEAKEVNFLIKTLNEVRKLDKEDVLALMATDITTKPKGFLNAEELVTARRFIEAIDFRTRKYNQLGHFWSAVLKNLDDLTIRNDVLYLTEDSDIIPDEQTRSATSGRDDYLQRIYKNQLKEEVSEKVGQVECMVERLGYPALIASHIKPYRESAEHEAYDPSNGLLLSTNMDALFDKGYISFENDGTMIIADRLSDDVQESLLDYSLNAIFITPERQTYLQYHREHVFRL